jgi:hypothetical protein
MIILGNGNVGIGTTSPQSRLDLGNGSDGARQISWHTNSTTSYGNIWQSRNGARTIIANGLKGSATVDNGFESSTSALWGRTAVELDYGTIKFYTNSPSTVAYGTNIAPSERVRIDSSGRLLVGTSSTFDANATFQCLGANAAQFFRFGADNAQVIIGSARGSQASPTILSSTDIIGGLVFRGCGAANTYYNGASIQAQIDGITPGSDLPTRLVFSTTADGASSPTQRMRITSFGFVLIGRQSEITFSTNTTDGVVIRPNRIDASAASVARITQIRDSTGTLDRFYNGTNIVGSISCTTTATAYNTSSDYRLKENVVSLVGAIDRLQQIPVHRFNFIADPDKTVDGFIAHEAQAVVPECVTGTKDEIDAEGNPLYQGIDQSKLVPLLTAALQEAIAEIASLKDRVAALEAS